MARRFYKAPSGGGGSFTPTSITGLQLWYDAADSATITQSSGAVSAWNDKSGNSNHCSQSTTGKQPTTNAYTQNSKNVINFTNGTYLGNTTYSFPKIYTIYAVGFTTITGYGRLLHASYSNDQYLLFGSASGNYVTMVGIGSGWTDLNQFSTQTSIQSNLTTRQFYLFGSTNDSTITGLNGYVNGTSVGTKSGVNATATGFTIGAYTGANVDSWNGLVGEIIMYNSVLSPNDRQKVEGYLAWKWGLTGSLPTGHPYKTVQP